MPEEIKEQISDSGEQMSDGTADYIEAIKEIKQNSVPKSEYAKLKEENKKLLDSIINGADLPDSMKASISSRPLTNITAPLSLSVTVVNQLSVSFITKILFCRGVRRLV